MARSTLSTAELRRPTVAAAAVRAFARGGYHGTTIADVAREAKISPAYVIKLFPTKEKLFTAALEACFDQILAALEAGADTASSISPDEVLDAMADAYAALITDRTLLLLQVHAQSVAEIPEIGAAFRAGLERIVTYAKDRSRGTDEAVQRFIAFGQLCHLLVAANVQEVPGPWARLLTAGMRHL
ncbi:TetR/AcrR family transcriptional regulator [Promicromonospora thailandica]|uniref:Transcriptional regulator, TetR family n=1 Tax=Promicromonospora thailandica TaxID=765201 RepID=A0A9X2G643_9MICO|nr:TetR/AcrR family transcriptional regulator [Promicromonospora thailandica]MCP2266037.1 transcriptional regulator, TetR family [Promicromonospora thailandica]BFF21368.1 TetR/AcrR family transcriptional regulator [Promicromonospora thailandica]